MQRISMFVSGGPLWWFVFLAPFLGGGEALSTTSTPATVSATRVPAKWAELHAYTAAQRAKLPAQWAQLKVWTAAQQPPTIAVSSTSTAPKSSKPMTKPTSYPVGSVDATAHVTTSTKTSASKSTTTATRSSTASKRLQDTSNEPTLVLSHPKKLLTKQTSTNIIAAPVETSSLASESDTKVSDTNVAKQQQQQPETSSTALIKTPPKTTYSRWYRNTSVHPSQGELLPINQGGSISNVVQNRVGAPRTTSSLERGGQLMDINRGSADVAHVIQSSTKTTTKTSMRSSSPEPQTTTRGAPLMDINQGGDISSVVRRRRTPSASKPAPRSLRQHELMDINKGSARVSRVVQPVFQPSQPEGRGELMDINKGSASVSHVVQPIYHHSQPEDRGELMDINKGSASVSHVVQPIYHHSQPEGRVELMDINKGSASVSHVVQQAQSHSQPEDRGDLMDINKGSADISHVFMSSTTTTRAAPGQTQQPSHPQTNDGDRGELMDINQGGDIATAISQPKQAIPQPQQKQREKMSELQSINQGGDILGVIQRETIG